MLPYEILLSESQERMLVVVQKGKEQIVKDILINGIYMLKKLAS
jgi:phosphoribosylformylglycinamidine synthase